MMNAATGVARAIQQQSVQNGARINDDGMLQRKCRPLILRADNLHLLNQFLRQRIVQQEREALRGFVGQPAAARFFPREMLVKNVDGVSCASELFAAHGSRRPTTDNDIVSHFITTISVVSISATGGMAALRG